MTDPERDVDRRSNLHLRKIFVEAYDLLKPFFDPANDWGGKSHEHLAYRALHENFPGLSAPEVFALVPAAKRASHDGGHPPS